jgi:hypothetical protein
MISPMKMKLTASSRQPSGQTRFTRHVAAWRKLNAYVAANITRLRQLAPYAAIELVLPGGSLIALFLWLYRRQKRLRRLATSR